MECNPAQGSDKSNKGKNRRSQPNAATKTLTRSEKARKFNAIFKRGKDKFENMDFKGVVHDMSRSLRLRPRHPEAHFFRSLARQMLRDEKGSSSDMEKYVLLKNSNIASFMRAGELAIARGDMEAGLCNLEKAIADKCGEMAIGLISKGHALEETKDYLGAIRQFAKAAELSPWSIAPLMARGNAYMMLHDFISAKKDFDRLLEMEGCAQGYIYRGACHFCLGNPNDALIDLTKGLGMDPESRSGLFTRANVLNTMGMFEAALNDITRVVQAYPKQEEFCIMKGTILLNMGKGKEAIEVFEALPKSSGVCYLMALAFGRLERSGDAIRCLDMAIKKEGNSHALYMKRYDMRLSIGDTKGAMEDHSRAMALKADNDFSSSMGAALALRNKGVYDEALSHASDAINMRPLSPEAYDLRGSIHFAAGRNKEAIADFTKAIELNPKEASYYDNRGMASFNLDNCEDALDDINKALSIQPRDINLRYNKAQALVSLERWEEAIALFSRLIRRYPDDSQLFFDRAGCFFSQGRFREAIRDLRAAIMLEPTNSMYYNDLGYAFHMIDRHSRAIFYYNKAIKAAGQENNHYIMSLANANIGGCMERLGNHYEAMRHYDLAVEACPQRPDSYYRRAQLKEKIGDMEGARLDMERAEDAGFGNDDESEVFE